MVRCYARRDARLEMEIVERGICELARRNDLRVRQLRMLYGEAVSPCLRLAPT
jgi:hypothetical protein